MNRCTSSHQIEGAVSLFCFIAVILLTGDTLRAPTRKHDPLAPPVKAATPAFHLTEPTPRPVKREII